MSNQEDLEVIDITIEQAKHSVDMAEALNKLKVNKAFIKVVLNGYFEKEATRLVLLKADPNMQSPEDQAQVLRAIDSIGSLRQYFITLGQLGGMAQKSIADCELSREEILAEGL
jgi:hypothetical protein|tara:strand:- start:6414 stop:6755 length:342 start_codon:yes stop_codon:yes gene_type:complete